MKKEEIIQSVMARVNPVIKNDTNLGAQQPLPQYLAVAEHYLGNLKIDKPAKGILGKIGAVKQCPIIGTDKEQIMSELRTIVEKKCIQTKKVNLTREISSSAIRSLVDVALSESGYTWALRALQQKAIITVFFGRRQMEIAVHYNKNMLNEINRILPAIKDVEQMRAKYGSDFKYQ